MMVFQTRRLTIRPFVLADLEDVLTALQELFSNGIRYILACCFIDNLPSKRGIEKCGFLFKQTGSFYSESLDKTFKNFEYCQSSEQWKEKFMSGEKI